MAFNNRGDAIYVQEKDADSYNRGAVFNLFYLFRRLLVWTYCPYYFFIGIKGILQSNDKRWLETG